MIVSPLSTLKDMGLLDNNIMDMEENPDAKNDKSFASSPKESVDVDVTSIASMSSSSSMAASYVAAVSPSRSIGETPSSQGFIGQYGFKYEYGYEYEYEYEYDYDYDYDNEYEYEYSKENE